MGSILGQVLKNIPLDKVDVFLSLSLYLQMTTDNGGEHKSVTDWHSIQRGEILELLSATATRNKHWAYELMASPFYQFIRSRTAGQ